MLLIILCSLLITYIVWYLVKLTLWALRASKIAANIPGHKPLPIIGNALLLKNMKNTEDMYKILEDLFKKHLQEPDYILKTWLGPKLIITLGNPKHVQTVIASSDAASKDYAYKFITGFGNGLTPANGREWAELRKPLNRILTKNMVESNVSLFHEYALKLTNMVAKYADTEEFVDLKHTIANYSADILAISTFGHPLNELENDRYQMLYRLNSYLDIMLQQAIRLPYSFCYELALFTKQSRKALEHSKKVWEAANMLLDGRMETRKKLGEKLDDKPKYFSDIVMQKAIRDKLNRDDTARLTTDLLAAAYDTSAITVSSVLSLIAMFPEHQEAVYNEVVNLLGEDPDLEPTWEQLSNMPYMTRVLNETLRLFGPINLLRSASNDIDLGDYKIPAGATVNLSLHFLHRHPRYWKHPDKFYPDHFLPEEVAKRPKGAYFPFSWGPRSCPGKLFGLTSIKVLLAALIRKYKFETNLKFENIKGKYVLMMEFAGGYHLKLTTRKCSVN